MGIQKIVFEMPLVVGEREVLFNKEKIVLDALDKSVSERNLFIYGDEKEGAIAFFQAMTGLKAVSKGHIEYQWKDEKVVMGLDSSLDSLFSHGLLLGYVSEMGLDLSRYFTMRENMWLSEPRNKKDFEERVCHYSELLFVQDYLDKKPEDLDVNVLKCFSLIKAWAIEPDVLIYFEPLSHIDNTRDDIVRREMTAFATSPDTISIVYSDDITDFPGFEKFFQRVDILREH